MVWDYPEALAASFVLSNVAPQVGPGMNRDYWARFERFVKTLATGAGGGGGGERSGSGDGEREVVVFTGPLYLPRRVKPGRGAPPNAPRYEMRHPMLGDPPRLVAVPTHFYKVALVLETALAIALSMTLPLLQSQLQPIVTIFKCDVVAMNA